MNHHFGTIAVTNKDDQTDVYRGDDGVAFASEVDGSGGLHILRRAKGEGEPELYAAYNVGAWVAAQYGGNANAEAS